MVFGGYGANNKRLRCIETYDSETKVWNLEKHFELEGNLSHYSVVNLNERIYILGGQNKDGALNEVKSFTFAEKQWSDCASMT